MSPKKILYRSVGSYLNLLHRVAPHRSASLGLKLFSSPRGAKVKKNQYYFLKSGDLERLDFSGVPIQTYRWGTGPRKILFVHGWESHSYRWKKYVESLPQDEFSLYAFDGPGHGLSGGKTFTVPLNAYLLQKVCQAYGPFEAVVGHSIGAMSTLYALAESKGLSTQKLIAMAAPGQPKDFFQFFENLLGIDPPTLASIQNLFQRRISKDLDDFQSWQLAQKLQVPGLIIHDYADQDTQYQNALNLHQAWSSSYLVSTRELGHSLKSLKVVQIVSDYLRYDALDKKLVKEEEPGRFELV